MGPLGRLGGMVHDRPWLSISIIVAITLVSCGSVLVNGVDTSFTVYDFMPDSEVYDVQEGIESTFGTKDRVILLVHGDGDDVLDQDAFLDVIENERRLLEDPMVSGHVADPDTDVVSLTDFVAMAIFQNMTETLTEEQLEMLGIVGDEPTYHNLERVISVTPTYRIKTVIHAMWVSPETPDELKTVMPLLVSDDFDPDGKWPSASAMVVLFELDEGSIDDAGLTNYDVESRMASLIDDGDHESTTGFLGTAYTGQEIVDSAVASIAVLFPVAAAVIVVIMLIVFRDALDVIVGVFGLLAAVAWMYGVGTAAGFTFNPMTIAVPILILGLGIDYAIHMVKRHSEAVTAGEDGRTASVSTVSSVGEALLLATVTTGIAFLSNLSSPLEPLRQFGVLAAVGVLSSFVIMVVLIPATNALRRPRPRAERKGVGTASFATLARRRPGTVLSATLAVTIVLGVLGAGLGTTFDIDDFLPDDSDTSQDLRYLEGHFEVSDDAAQVLVSGAVLDPELVRDMESSVDEMADDEYVIVVDGVPDTRSLLTLMRDWATDSSGSGYEDPHYDEGFAALYHGSFDEDGIMDDATEGGLLAIVSDLDALDPDGTSSCIHRDGDVFDLLIDVAETPVEGDGVWTMYEEMEDDVSTLSEGRDVTVTGDAIVNEVIISDLDTSQWSSLLITIAVSLTLLTAVMFVSHRSWLLGPMATMPVVLCVVWVWGTMWLLSIPLNVMTMTIASLTVGVGVTYGIHVVHRFVEELGQGVDGAISTAVSRTGGAVAGAALTTIAGFGILSLSNLPPIQQFGSITAVAILYSLLASLVVLPATLVLWGRRHERTM